MNTTKKTYQLAITGLFIALVLILGLTPLGLIPLGFVNLTILHIPVIIGTILLGLKTGLILGACFGIVSTLCLLGLSLAPASALGYTLLAANPAYAILMCIVPRLLVPTFTWLVYRLVSRGREKCLYAVQLGVAGLSFVGIIGAIAAGGGGMEALAAALIAPPVAAAVWKIKK